MSSDDQGLIEVLAGHTTTHTEWAVFAGGTDEDFTTEIAIQGKARLDEEHAGFRGPKLEPGSVVNVWHGSFDNGPVFVVARARIDIDYLEVTTSTGEEIALDISLPVSELGLRFAVADLPSGTQPSSLRAYREKEALELVTLSQRRGGPRRLPAGTRNSGGSIVIRRS